MKYRVKFQCYWYNTGAADNHYYINNVDFDTLGEAEKFRDRVNEQYNMGKKIHYLHDEKMSNPSEYQKKYCMTRQAYNKWEENFEFIDIENGFISSEASVVKYYPSQEQPV